MSPNRNDMKNEFRHWRSLGRVFLFIIGCAIILAVITPLAPKKSGLMPQVFIGAIASLWALGLTILFVRWEGLRLNAVGASPDRRSLLRFAIGFLIGAILVALNSTILWSAGHVRWVRVPEIGFSDVIIALVAYLSLSVREELDQLSRHERYTPTGFRRPGAGGDMGEHRRNMSHFIASFRSDTNWTNGRRLESAR
jgi:hypothetical protein